MKLVYTLLVGAWCAAIPSIFLTGSAIGMQNMAQDSGVLQLPGELMSEIFEYLPEEDLVNASLVCKEWLPLSSTALMKIKRERRKLAQKYGSLQAALYQASMYGLIGELRFLVGSQVIDINQVMGFYGSTPLIAAVVHNHIHTVKYLIEQGKADVSKCQNDGSTPLSLAAYLGYKNMVQYFVENACADVVQPGKDGFSSFMWAVSSKHFGVAEYLAHHGADINEAGNNGWNALMAMTVERNSKGVQCLLELGADLDRIDDNGRTVVELAQQSDSDEIMQFLLEAKTTV